MKDVAKEKIGKIMLSVFGLKTALKIYFRLKTKMKLNLDNPKRYSEKIQLRNITTGEKFTFNYHFIDNDVITINTNKGEKSIYLQRGINKINLFTSLTNDSSFFQLDIGENYFSYLVDDGAHDEQVRVIFKHNTLYGGV